MYTAGKGGSMLRHAWLIAVIAAAPLAAQKSGPQGDTWESIAKLPDFGGLWEGGGGGPRGAGARAAVVHAAVRGEARRSFKPRVERGEIEDGPSANCVPNGMPSIMTQPYPIEILFTPGKVTILIEAYAQWRQIFTDGREHPEDPDLTFNGHSIGHWEGGTLVVDTVGFTTDTSLGGGGMRHSEKMHIVERFRIADGDRLEVANDDRRPRSVDEAVHAHRELRPPSRLDAGRVRVPAEQPQLHDRRRQVRHRSDV